MQEINIRRSLRNRCHHAYGNAPYPHTIHVRDEQYLVWALQGDDQERKVSGPSTVTASISIQLHLCCGLCRRERSHGDDFSCLQKGFSSMTSSVLYVWVTALAPHVGPRHVRNPRRSAKHNVMYRVCRVVGASGFACRLGPLCCTAVIRRKPSSPPCISFFRRSCSDKAAR